MAEHLGGSDEQLMASVRGGDHRAASVLRARHQPAADRLARSLLGAEGPAEDAVAEAFARVLARQLAGPADQAFEPLLLDAVRRVAEGRRAGGGDRSRPALPAEGVCGPVEHVDTPRPAPALDRTGGRQRAGHQCADDTALGPPLDEPGDLAPPDALSGRWRQATVRRHLRDEPDPTCRAIVARLEGYVAGAALPWEDLEVADHIDECERCEALHRELAAGRPRVRPVVASMLAVTCVLTLLAILRPVPGTEDVGPTVTVEMADTSTTPTRPSTSSTASPGTPNTSASSTTATTVSTGAPASTIDGGPSGETTEPDSPDVGPPTTRPPLGPAEVVSPPPSTTTWLEPDLLLAGDAEPPPAGHEAPRPTIPPPTTTVEGLAPFTLSVTGGLTPGNFAPVTLMLRSPEGSATDVVLRLTSEVGMSFDLQPRMTDCSVEAGALVCRWSELAPGGVDVFLLGPMLGERTSPVALDVALEVAGGPTRTASVLVPVASAAAAS